MRASHRQPVEPGVTWQLTFPRLPLPPSLGLPCLASPSCLALAPYRKIGSGFAGTLLSGKTHNDEFYVDEDGHTRTRTNRSGGVQGGISNGETIVVRVVRPTAHTPNPVT